VRWNAGWAAKEIEMIENKIVAIKKLREAAAQATFERNETGHMEIRPGIHLREAKELVEEVMELGVAEYLKRQNTLASRIESSLRDLENAVESIKSNVRAVR
jgi:hypothetical protein